MKSADVFSHFKELYPRIASPQRATAVGLGLSKQAVYLWGDEVPQTSQALVEIATEGKFKSDFTLKRLAEAKA